MRIILAPYCDILLGNIFSLRVGELIPTNDSGRLWVDSVHHKWIFYSQLAMELSALEIVAQKTTQPATIASASKLKILSLLEFEKLILM